jgi:hypothetical protein
MVGCVATHRIVDRLSEGIRSEPLFGQASLQEWHTRTEIGQSVHPARDFLTA